MTVAQYLDRWIDGRRKGGLKDSTLIGYEVIVRKHLGPNLGKHRLGALRPDHVQAMLNRIGREPARSRRKKMSEVWEPPTAGTLLNIRAALRAALNDALRQQLVPRNVATLVTIPSPRRPRPVALSTAQVLTFLNAAQDHELYPLWYLVAVYGFRRAEAIGLRWDAVDKNSKLLRVSSTVLDVAGDHPCPFCRRTHRRLKFDTTKTPAGERIYPLVPAVQVVLDRRKQQELTERDLYGDDYADHGLIFAQADGNPWRPDWISNQFTSVMTSSGAADGLPQVPSLKALRSTMVTNLHEAGTPLEVISRLTGHTGGEVTRDHYLHISAERTRKEFTDIAERIAGKKSTDPLDGQPGLQERSDPQGDPHAPGGDRSEDGAEEN